MSPLKLLLDPDVHELSTMRRRLRDHLRELHEPSGDWLLVATELAMNSIEASPQDRSVEVELIAHADRIELHVSDEGPGYEPTVDRLRTVGPGAARGRGLLIVKALAESLDVARVEGRTTTVVERQRNRRVDVAVIGLGSAGEAASSSLARAGRSVVGFEPSRVGGECPFVACMPSKSMLFDAHQARHTGNQADRWREAVARRQEIVDDLDDSAHAAALTDAGVELVREPARISGPGQVTAGGHTWEADHVLLATGSAPVIPTIDGLDRTRVWTAFDALTATDLPNRVLILGAGAVGCELSDVYAGFGSKVVLVDHADRLLPDHDAEVADLYLAALRSFGIDIRLGASVRAIDHGDDATRVQLDEGSIDVDQVIVAAGQAPRLDGLGLETIGLEPDVVPNLSPDRSVAGHDGLWVLGDLNAETPWTHGANRDAAIVTGAITGAPWSRTSSAMPHATFTNPPAAHVGTAADEENGHLRGAGRYSDIARLSTDDLNDGLVVVAVDALSGTVVGCSAVGPLADEIIATATALIHHEISVVDARTQVFAFPTISQVLEVAIADAADQWDQRQAS
jgi:dihydrolipoamide dehydrogenase